MTPCQSCLTFVMCKNRYLKSKRDTRSPLANLYVLIDKCDILDDYLFEEQEGRANRIFKSHDIFNGDHHESSL